MPSPPTEESKALFKILVDVEDITQWRFYDEVRDALALTVAPGKAFRRYQDRLAKERRRRGSNETQSPLSDQAQIFYGARDVAQATISSWTSRGGLLSEGNKDQRKIRINPAHKGWGTFQLMVEQDADKARESRENAAGLPDLPPEDSGASEAPPVPPEDVFPGVEGTQDAVAPAGPEPEAVSHGSPWQEPLLTRAQRMERAVAASAGEEDPWSPAVPEPEPEVVEQSWTPPVQATGQQIPDWLQSVDLSKIVLCPICKVLVIDSIDHDKWHVEQDALHADREMALINEKELRTLLGDVIRLELDDFRSSLAHYLETEFSELRRAIASLRLQPRSAGRWPVSRESSTDGP